MNKMITVTAQIGKCIYQIEMQTKNTLAEIINEVKNKIGHLLPNEITFK